MASLLSDSSRANRFLLGGLLAVCAFLLPRVAQAGTLWSVDGATVSTAANDQLMTHAVYGAASDGDGGVYVVYTDTSLATPNARLQHLDSNGVPVSGWSANGVLLTNTVTGQCANQSVSGSTRHFCPAVVADGAGGAFAVWQDWRSGTPQAYAQRVTYGGTALWGANGILVATSPGGFDEAGAPFVADDGTYFVLYFDSAPVAQGGINWRVQKLNPVTGAQLLGAQGVVVSSIGVQAFGGYAPPAPDGAGGFIFLWSDQRAGVSDANVFGLRVNGSGQKVWEITVASGTGDQFFPASAPDGSNGVYTVWHDSRAGNGEVDVYATRIKADGTAASGWTIGDLGGKVVCNAGGMQFLATVDRYGTDMVATWWDLRDGTLAQKVRGQRLSATGTQVWDSTGPVLFNGTGGFANGIVAPVVRVFSNTIFVALGWVQTTTVFPAVTGFDHVVGQVVSPSDGSTVFGGTGTYLGNEVIVLSPGVVGLPRAYQVVASTKDDTVIVSWIAGAFGATDIYAQKFSASGLGGGGGGGGTPSPTNVRFTAVSTGSVNAQWDLSTGNSYVIALSTSASFASVVSSGTGALNQNTTSFADLSPATYYFKVKVSTHPDSAYSTAISTEVTGPPPPPAPANVQFTSVSSGSLAASWTLNTGSQYVIALATVSSFATTLSSGTGALNQNTTSYANLGTDATYYFKVKVSTNPDASYSTALSTYLAPPPPPPAPSNVQYTAVSTSSLSLSWTVSTGNSYLMVLSTSSSFATVLSSATGALNQNTTSYFGLAPGATHYFKVKISTNPDASYSSAISTVTGIPPAPTNVRFTAVSTTSLSAAWDLSSGSAYLMVLSTDSTFATTFSSAVGTLNQVTTTYAVTGGTWYFKVKVSTHPDLSFSSAISTTSALQPGGSLSTTVSTGAATTFNIPATLPIKVDVPAGAFGGGANNLTATVPVTVPPASTGGGTTVTPLGQAITLDLATPVAQFSKAVDLAITIPPPADPTNIYLAWYDELLRTWWPIWTSYYNAILQQVIGQTFHFTTFAAVRVSAATTLDDMTVFPNPVSFDSSARGTLKFMGLTAGADIQIYTVLGERVRHLPTGFRSGANVNDGTSGFAEWDGKNENGERVARGTLIYVITDPKGSRKTGRIGVKR